MIVVVPHNYKITDQEKTDIENYVFWDQYQKKPVYTYKTETELTKEDIERNLQLYGPFCYFQMDEVQNIPIKPVKLMKGLTFFYELLLIYLVEK